MVFCKRVICDPVTLALYDQLLLEAPLGYLEATEEFWIDDLYFIANAESESLSNRSGLYLMFHYTDQ